MGPIIYPKHPPAPRLVLRKPWKERCRSFSFRFDSPDQFFGQVERFTWSALSAPEAQGRPPWTAAFCTS